MNVNRTKLKEFLNSHPDSELFLGNKIVKCIRDERVYFDISTVKEIFGKSKNNDDIFSLTDVSNFHILHMPSIYVGDNSKPLSNDTIIAPYTNLQFFTPMKKQRYYVTHLQPIWYYGKFDGNIDEIMHFLTKYNEKNEPGINEKIGSGHLQVNDWWYVGGECMKEEDYIDIVSTYEENLSRTLGAVYDGGYPASKCIKKSFGKR